MIETLLIWPIKDEKLEARLDVLAMERLTFTDEGGAGVRNAAATHAQSRLARAKQCPFCSQGPILNENCSDLRAHHGQCQSCGHRPGGSIEAVDGGVAASMAAQRAAFACGARADPPSVLGALPRCSNCAKTMNDPPPLMFNGCYSCGESFAKINWEHLPMYEPKITVRMTKRAAERVAQEGGVSEEDEDEDEDDGMILGSTRSRIAAAKRQARTEALGEELEYDDGGWHEAITGVKFDPFGQQQEQQQQQQQQQAIIPVPPARSEYLDIVRRERSAVRGVAALAEELQDEALALSHEVRALEDERRRARVRAAEAETRNGR